jgi:hypothetical protein
VDAPRKPDVDGEECVKSVQVPGLQQCCGGTPVFTDLANRSISGRLPDGFSPAKEYTDLSNNPRLCGSIRKLPPGYDVGATARNPPPFVNLHNTSVQLDMAEMSSYKFLGVQVAYWLGTVGSPAPLSSHNIENMLSFEQSLYICGLLLNGKIHGVERAPQGVYMYNHTAPNDSSVGAAPTNTTTTTTCTCNSPNAFMDRFKGTWECCHQRELELEFDLSLQGRRALLHYNAYAKGKDPFGECGSRGQSYRTILVVILCAGGVGIFVVFLLLGSCVRCLCNDSGCLSTWVRFLLDAADVGTDCFFIWTVAANGNFYAVVCLGFGLLGSSILQSLACLIAYEVHWCWVMLAAVVLVVGGVVPPAMTAQLIQAKVGFQAIVLGDTQFLASLLLGVAGPLCAAAAIGSLVKALSIGKINDEAALNRFKLFRRVMFFTEDIPQFAMQMFFWMNAAVAVPLLEFLITGIITVISLAYGFAEVVLHHCCCCCK